MATLCCAARNKDHSHRYRAMGLGKGPGREAQQAKRSGLSRGRGKLTPHPPFEEKITHTHHAYVPPVDANMLAVNPISFAAGFADTLVMGNCPPRVNGCCWGVPARLTLRIWWEEPPVTSHNGISSRSECSAGMALLSTGNVGPGICR